MGGLLQEARDESGLSSNTEYEPLSQALEFQPSRWRGTAADWVGLILEFWGQSDFGGNIPTNNLGAGWGVLAGWKNLFLQAAP